MMNVTFSTPSKELDALFVKQSIEDGMSNLKGHRAVGGIRASIYNAMPLGRCGTSARLHEALWKQRTEASKMKVRLMNKISQEGLKRLPADPL